LNSSFHIIDVPDGGIITVSQNGQHVSLWNETSAFIISSLKDQTAEEIALTLSAHFQIAYEIALADVQATIANLNKNPKQESLDQNIFASASFAQKYFDLDGMIFSLHAPMSLLDMMMALWSHRECEPSASTVNIEIALLDDFNGNLKLNGVEKIDHAPIHVLLGGVYQHIVETLHPASQWGAFIHAAAVSKNGNGVILAAQSGSGKSTLTAMLVAAGYEYHSDDMVPLTFRNHKIAAFPLPITVKHGAAKTLAPLFKNINADEKTLTQHIIQDRSFKAAKPIAKALVFPKYVKDAATSFEDVSVSDSLLRLFEDRIHFGYPVSVERVQDFVQWLSSVPRKTLVYSKFEEAEQSLSTLI
jgi:Coenzyme PQQ synthesis protein D (PqqD)